MKTARILCGLWAVAWVLATAAAYGQRPQFASQLPSADAPAPTFSGAPSTGVGPTTTVPAPTYSTPAAPAPAFSTPAPPPAATAPSLSAPPPGGYGGADRPRLQQPGRSGHARRHDPAAARRFRPLRRARRATGHALSARPVPVGRHAHVRHGDQVHPGQADRVHLDSRQRRARTWASPTSRRT